MEPELLRKIERREFIRMEIPLTVRVRILDQENIIGRKIEKAGTICNISVSGACLELDPPSRKLTINSDDSLFEFKNKMHMEIELFDELKKISVVAESHWYHLKTIQGKRRLYVGVSFLEMNKNDHGLLEHFLSSIEKGSFFMKNQDESLPV